MKIRVKHEEKAIFICSQYFHDEYKCWQSWTMANVLTNCINNGTILSYNHSLVV